MLSTIKSLPQGTCYKTCPSPVGPLTLLASDEGIHAVLWKRDLQIRPIETVLQHLRISDVHPLIREARKQLEEYFSCERTAFDLPLAFSGTPFQNKVWKALLEIPYGSTVSYQDLAKRLGNINSARAVGVANSKNPISIIVPCHRVIGQSGDLTGFAGGLDAKRFLIELEKENLALRPAKNSFKPVGTPIYQ